MSWIGKHHPVPLETPVTPIEGPIVKRKTEDLLPENPDLGETVRLNVKEGQLILDARILR
jgi:hypothetical protein